MQRNLSVPAFVTIFLINISLADAQQVKKLPRIGYLAPRASASPPDMAFKQGLQELGWIEGQTILVDYHWVGDKVDRLNGLAEDLVHLNPDVIAAGSTPLIQAVKS